MIPDLFKFTLAVSFIFVLAVLGVFGTKNIKEKHSLMFFDKVGFYSSIFKAESEKDSFSNVLYGGIIPHDLFAGEIIADFYRRISNQQPKTIFVIGPNHSEEGKSHVLTSLRQWETPFGPVETDEKKTLRLLEEGAAVEDKVIEEDHAVAGSIPYIKYYMPHAKVVPLLLSGYMTINEIDSLANSIGKIIEKEDVVIASVDFSHYLTSPQAKRNDEVALKFIKENNYLGLQHLNSNFLDSPPSIITLLKVMDKIGAHSLDVLKNTNSGEMQRKDDIETTSYFEIIFQK